jgi:hypothetical protein
MFWSNLACGIRLECLVKVHLSKAESAGVIQFHDDRWRWGDSGKCTLPERHKHGPRTGYAAFRHAEKSQYWRTRGYALLNPLHNYPVQTDHSVGPFGGGLPKKVEVGEQFSVYFTAYHDGLAEDEFNQIGFHDLYGRNSANPFS